MEKDDIDKAFEWLIVVIGIITAILNQYPEYFYAVTPNPDRPFSLRVAIGVVPTMVAITMIWLIGKLSSRSVVQALAKVTAWILITNTTIASLVFYSMGVMIAFGRAASEVAFMPMLALLGIFIFCPIVTYNVLIPKYREMYPDISVLRNKVQLIFLIVSASILSLFFFFLTH